MPAEVETFVSFREVPWHGLGVVTDEELSIDELCKRANLFGWNVRTVDSYARVGSKYVKDPDSRKIVRDNPFTGEPEVLGTGTPIYKPTQNETVAQFLQTLVSESAETVHGETAGSLRGGKRVFVTCKVPRDIVIDPTGPADKVDTYLLSTTGHDGRTAFQVAVTPIRVVCMNTLNAALRGTDRIWTHWHLTDNVMAKVAEAQQVLGITYNYIDAFEAWASGLYQQAVTDAQFAEMVKAAFPLDDDATKQAKTNVEKRREQVHAIYNGDTVEPVRGTAWGAYNALTEWADHYRVVLGSQDEQAERRFISNAIEGPAIEFKRRAQQIVEAAVN